VTVRKHLVRRFLFFDDDVDGCCWRCAPLSANINDIRRSALVYVLHYCMGVLTKYFAIFTNRRYVAVWH